MSVSGLTGGTTAVMTGMSYHSCARTLSNGLKCWGLNLYGQLGDGTELPASTTPVTLSAATGTYAYDATHKHAVANVTLGTGTPETYSYDANGNMTQRVENGSTYTQTFDAENRLISVTVNSQTTQFIYDGDGNLVKKINPDNSRTIYVGGLYEVDKNSGGTVTRNVTYYPTAGAMRINVIDGSNTLYFTLKDHLGSASIITDMTGNAVSELRYYPYGETRLATGSILTDRLFTGQREITGLGIYHYGARFYSPKSGRFLSADTIVPGYANPQAFNRYSYVFGNPLRFTDPSGRRPCGDGEAIECDGKKNTPQTTKPIGCGGKGQRPCGGGDGCDLECEFENTNLPVRDSEGDMESLLGQDLSSSEYVLLTYYIEPGRGRVYGGSGPFYDYFLILRIFNIREQAKSATRTIYGLNANYSPYIPADAFRHAFGSALMTRKFGPEFALAFTTAHETQASTNPEREELAFMDLHNNAVGVSIALANPNATQKELIDLVMAAIADGQMVVYDGNGIYQSNECPAC